MYPTSAESLGFAAAGVVVYNFVEGGVHMAQTSPLHLHSLPVTFGLSAFVYSGHAVFPSIYRSMKDRSQYPRMLDTTYAIVGITGAFMGEPHMPSLPSAESNAVIIVPKCMLSACSVVFNLTSCLGVSLAHFCITAWLSSRPDAVLTSAQQ